MICFLKGANGKSQDNKLNIFVKDSQPEGYNGIWIKSGSFSYNTVVEITNMTELVSNAINLLKGADAETELINSDIITHLRYKLKKVLLTDNSNNILYDIPVYCGTGSNWEDITATPASELEYIESTGTQYINPNVGVRGAGLIVEIKYLFEAHPSGMGRIIGTDRDQNYEIATTWKSNSSFRWGVSGSSGATYNVTANAPHIFKSFEDGRLDVDGNTVQNSGGSSPIYSNLYILNGYDNQRAIGKLYYCKIWERNTLIRDFIPFCDDNKVACLYDKVTEQFFYNSGTGSFIAGNKK